MKKSRIILPAVALLTISTVAAASSTVAWFAASRDVDFTVSQIAVYNPESALNVELNANAAAGTTTDGNTITMPKKMRDGSVDLLDDATTAPVYKKDVVTGKYSVAAWTEDKTTDVEPVDVYRATSWTMTFSMKAPAADDYAIFFNPEEMKLTAGTDNGNISYAFRLGFVSGTGDAKVTTVVAPFGDHSTKDATLKHVTAVDTTNDTTTATGSYNGHVFNTKDQKRQATEIAKNDILTTCVSTKGYIGTITAGTNELVVTCYAWFEGEDANCIVPTGDDKTINTVVSGTINFSASRLLKA